MKIFKIIHYAFLGAIALIAVLLVVSIFPIPGNFKALTVLSGSMEPGIKTGSVVVVTPADDYKIGDVITFGPTSKTKPPTTHRIYDIKVIEGNPIYLTKGDANKTADTREVSRKDVIGKVLFSVPYAGFIVETARKPYGFLALIVIPAVIIIYDEARKIIAEIKRMKKKKEEKENTL